VGSVGAVSAKELQKLRSRYRGRHAWANRETLAGRAVPQEDAQFVLCTGYDRAVRHDHAQAVRVEGTKWIRKTVNAPNR
jgi:hypothetical protein